MHTTYMHYIYTHVHNEYKYIKTFMNKSNTNIFTSL